MKKLEFKRMENLEGGKLCSSDGYTVAAGIGACFGGAIGAVAFYAGAWIGCSL